MKDDKSSKPEIKLLSSIIDEELKLEEDNEMKEIIKRKADTLYPLLSLLETRGLDRDEIKKKIRLLIEED